MRNKKRELAWLWKRALGWTAVLMTLVHWQHLEQTMMGCPPRHALPSLDDGGGGDDDDSHRNASCSVDCDDPKGENDHDDNGREEKEHVAVVADAAVVDAASRVFDVLVLCE